MMKRIAAVLLTVLMLCQVLLSHAEVPLDAVYELGAHLRQLAEKPDYLRALGASEDALARCAGFTGEADTPCRVYVYPVDKLAYLSLVMPEEDFSGLTDAELDYLATRSFFALPTELNAYAGVEALVAASILNWSTTILCDAPASSCYYVLEYEAYAAPVMVSMVPGDGFVNLYGTFLAVEDPFTVLSNLVPADPEIIELT